MTNSTSSKSQTIDERIESLLTDRKILLFRYDAHLRRQIWQKLTALQRQLLTRISATGIEAISKKELEVLLRDVRKTISEHYSEVSEFSQNELTQLLPVEVNATTSIYNEAVRFDLFNSTPEITRQAVNSAQIIAGSPLEKWWQKQSNDLAFKFEGIIRQGMLDGKQTSQLISEVKELMATSRRHSETLVRTAVMKVHDKAQEIVRDNNLDILKGEQQISTLDLRTSDVCRVRDGKAWDLDKKPIGDHDLPYARPPLHPNCLLGDTNVLSRCGVSAAFKRWFKGEIVVIKTASGFELSTTPNHPILTRQGWVPSDELNVGNYVVCDGVGQWRDRRNWDDDNVPTSIEQLTSSFLMSSKMSAVSMPVSSVDFHGDGVDGDIAIVATNRFLMNTLNASLFEHIHQNILELGRISFCSLNRYSLFSQNVSCCFLSSSSNMGFINEFLPFFLRSNSHSSELLLTSISCINTILLQDKFNSFNRDSEFLVNSSYANTRIEQIYNILMSFIDVSQNNVCIAYQLFRFCSDLYRVICEQSNNNLTGNVETFSNICGSFPRFIKSDDFIRRQCSNGSFSDGDSIFLNDSIQNEVRDIELAHNLIDGNIIKVFFDQVVSIERKCFSGHVYNLETKGGWYIANGILTHNCRSTMRLLTKSWRELGFDIDEIPESTRASMDGQVKQGLTYEDWLKGKSPEQQDQVLGKGKADLWRRGVITFRDMLDQSGRPLTLKQLSQEFSGGSKWQEHFKKLNNDPVVYSEKAQELFSLMKENKVEYNEVQKLEKQLTQQEIIDKISGGDMTEGSCASLALAYIGNKHGLDVTDFRGGKSRETFAWNGYKVLSLPGVISKEYIVGRAESREVAEILRATLEINKEYYLSSGRHAAIVRKTESDFEYLELQSANKNGWKSLTKNGRGKIANVLHERFKTAKLSKYRHYMRLAEVDSFKDNKEFEKILGYLNTAEDKQLKGSLGSEK